MCYMDNVELENCKLLNTTLAFEYSTVKADIVSTIDSITNPYEGMIRAEEIKEIIFEEAYVDPVSYTHLDVYKRQIYDGVYYIE